MTERDRRAYDIIVYGATGFTGQLCAEYLARYYPLTSQSTIQWAIAGRSVTRLTKLSTALSRPTTTAVPVIIASSSDYDSLVTMAGKCRVLIATVGPFATQYGEAVIKACIQANTHYLDITGETKWIRAMIDRHGQRAAETNKLFLPFSGFDSVPSLLSFYYATHTLAKKYNDVQIGDVSTTVTTKGGFSGGTLATVLNQFEVDRETTTDVDASDPWLLVTSQDFKQKQKNLNVKPKSDRLYPVYHRARGVVTVPFVMGFVNSRVVRMAISLLNTKETGHYVRADYEERMALHSSFLGSIVAALLFYVVALLFVVFAYFMPTRALLKQLLPGSGAGPSASARKQMYYRYETIASDRRNPSKCVTVEQVGPEAYEATAVFACEIAALIVEDSAKSERTGIVSRGSGFTSILAVMASELLDRVQQRGVRFRVID